MDREFQSARNGAGPRLLTLCSDGRAFLPVHLQHICTNSANETMLSRMSIVVRSELETPNIVLREAQKQV
jgi:hypothetical protein